MAETNNKDGRWVTLDNGVHLFIKKGQTLDDAIEKLENNPEKPKEQIEWAKSEKEKLYPEKPTEEENDYKNLSAREYGKKYSKGGNNGARTFTDEDRERLDMANSWQEQIKIAKEINKRNGNTEAFDYLNAYLSKPAGMEKALKRENIKTILNKPHRSWQEVEDVINQTSEDESLKSKAIRHAQEYYKTYISEAKNKRDKQSRQDDLDDIEHVIKNGDTNYFWRMDTIIRDEAVAFIEKALLGKSKDFKF